MFARTVAILAAAALAPAVAFAQENQPADPAIVEGKVESLAEQYAETKVEVAGLKKLKISGYVQARWAWQEAARYWKGSPDKDNFYVRRGRFKAVADGDLTRFVLQLDAIPSGVSVKEAYAQVKLPAGWAIDAGLQLFPFGYEVASRSSSDLDLLERSQVTVHLLDGEYDAGVSLHGKLGPVALRAGVFNGNGVKGATAKDNDQAKDVIGRATIDLGQVTGGLSGWYGKTTNYSVVVNGGHATYDRVRFGADVQVFLDLLPIGGTVIKGEYLWGKTGIGSANGGAGKDLDRAASGAYVILGQSLGQSLQFNLRYDTFINHAVDVAGATNAKVKQTDEVSAALHAFIGAGGKLSLAYYHPTNGTRGAAALADPKTDRIEAQLQAKF